MGRISLLSFPMFGLPLFALLTLLSLVAAADFYKTLEGALSIERSDPNS
jgi:hypothetical protein